MKHPSVGDSMMQGASMRLDKWLWVARLFKTRRLATDAVRSGRVLINDHVTKPGKLVKAGDLVTIRSAVQMSVAVMKLESRRGPASEAVQLYQETQQSIDARRTAENEFRFTKPIYPNRRPKNRRAIIRFNRSFGSDIQQDP